MFPAHTIAKIRHTRYSFWRRNLSHNSLSLPDSFGFLGGTVFSPRLIPCELSRLRCHGHSLLSSSYLCRIKRKKNSSCSACGYPLPNLTRLLLVYPASEPFRRAIFGTTFSILTSIFGSPWSFSTLPSLGRGRVVPTPAGSEGETARDYS